MEICARGWISGQLRLWLRMHEGGICARGWMSGQLRLPAVRAFGRRCLRPQEPSAGPTAFSNATSCPYPMPIVRALTVSGRSDVHWISCSLQARAAAADLSSLVPVNTPECNQLNLPIKCSAGHASHAQPWHTLARSPGTQVHRLLSCHSLIPSSPSPACFSAIASNWFSRTVKTVNPERKSRT